MDEIPESLIDQETQILTQGMKDEDIKKNKESLKKQAIKRIKTGLILNAYGEKNNIKVSQEEINTEVQKQIRMMPGQEKMVSEYYEKNPSALDSLRGSIYEEKIISQIKKNVKVNKKDISKTEAEKILKEENEKNIKKQENLTQHRPQKENNKEHKEDKKKSVKGAVNKKKTKTTKKAKPLSKKTSNTKKVSKK